MNSLAVVILGAGFSQRMGRPKLLLPWDHTSVIGYLIKQSRNLKAQQIAIVLNPDNLPLIQELQRLEFPTTCQIPNTEPERGMFHSIQTAARWPHWQPQLTHWAICLGDQPHVQNSTLESVLAHAQKHPDSICQPSLHGRPKHPVILPQVAFRQLSTHPSPTLAHWLQNTSIKRTFIETPDPGLALDLDTPDDYQIALRNFSNTLKPQPSES